MFYLQLLLLLVPVVTSNALCGKKILTHWLNLTILEPVFSFKFVGNKVISNGSGLNRKTGEE